MAKTIVLPENRAFFAQCKFCKCKRTQLGHTYEQYGPKFLIHMTCQTCSRPNTSMRLGLEND